MTANELVDKLEAQKLLPAAMTEKLREKANGPKALSAKALAKFLTDKGHLTKHQAATVMADEPVAVKSTTTEAKSDGKSKPEKDKQSSKPGKEKPPASKPKPRPEPNTDPSISGLSGIGLPLEDLADLGSPLEATSGNASAEGDPFGGAATLASEEPKGKKGKKRGKKSHKKSNEWDSPLILIIGGLLLVLALGIAAMYFIMNMESGDKLLAAARASRDTGSYSDATANYERFVEKFSKHEQFSKARVELAIVRIRKEVENKKFDFALTIAVDELKAVDNEAEFATAETELAELLPDIAQGLADKADTTEESDKAAELVTKAELALSMCENTRYIPRNLRDETQLNTIRETLIRIDRRQEALAGLESTITKIDEAIAAGDTSAAYTARATLVKEHPDLFGNEKLTEALGRISQAEQAGIKFVAEPIEASTSEPPTPVVATLAIANQRVMGTAPTTGPYTVIAGSAAYGIDAASGQMLWRRTIGPQIKQLEPVAIEDDVLIVDTLRKELLRLASATGELKWRLPIGETMALPVVHGGRIFLASEKGKLYVVDAATGNAEGFVQFAQPLRSEPALDPRGGRLYLVGGQTSIYVLGIDGLDCLGVYFSGHAAGTIVASPAVVLNKIVVIENDGVETSQLRLLGLDRDGVITSELKRERLEGLVMNSPAVAGRRFVVATDGGMLSVFDVNPGNEGDPLTRLASQVNRARQPFVRYVAIDGSNLWFASGAISKLVVAPTGNRLVVQQISDDYKGSQFSGPMTVRDGVLLHSRRRPEMAGITVTATDASLGKTIWETDVATPPAGGVLSNDNPPALMLADANGQVHVFDRDAIRSQIQNTALASSSGNVPLLDSGQLLPGGSALFATPGAESVLLVKPPTELNVVKLPGPLASAPAAFADGWLAPLSLGQVQYLDGETGQQVAGPFQPSLPPGVEKKWLPIAVVDGQQPSFVISDGLEKIYLVGLDGDGAYLAALNEAAVGTSALSTRLVAVADRVFGGTADGRLISFTLPALEPAERVELGASITWGPYRAGDLVILATGGGRLFGVSADGQKLWEEPSPTSDFAGPPLVAGEELLMSFESGRVVSLSLADGKMTGTTETGQPLVGGVQTLQQKFVVATQDGAILVIDKPQAASE